MERRTGGGGRERGTEEQKEKKREHKITSSKWMSNLRKIPGFI
jgi:hypothetical protein